MLEQIKQPHTLVALHGDGRILADLQRGLEGEGLEVWPALTCAEVLRTATHERDTAAWRTEASAVAGGNGNGSGTGQVNGNDSGPDGVEGGKPELLLIELKHPGGGAAELAARLREELSDEHLPWWVWTEPGREEAVVRALEDGADDWLSTSADLRLTAARIRAFLRREKRPSAADSEAFCHILRRSGVSVDLERHVVDVAGSKVELTKTEFKLLWQLLRRPGQVFTRTQLLDICCGESSLSVDRTIDVHIHSLRKKLGPSGNLLETVRGVGYRARDDAA